MSEIISVHGNYNAPPSDSMYDAAYSSACFNNPHLMCNAWPQIMVDRKLITDPDSIFYFFNQVTNDSAVADITVQPSFNTSTRELNVTATAHFAVNAAGYRLALVLTEDSVHGTSINYSQRNLYSGGAYGPLASPTIDFTTQPDPVPASLMYYRNVSRGIYPSFSGAAASLPATLDADSTYSYSFPLITVNPNYNASKMRAIVLLIQNSTGKIINANGANLADSVTGVQVVLNNNPSFSVSPNPFSSQTVFKIDNSSQNVNLTIYNALGQAVKQINNIAGQSVIFQRDNLSSGLYFAKLTENNKVVAVKTIVITD